MLKVLVSRDGLPKKVDLERSSGTSALDESALRTVLNWRFVPAKRGGEPIEAWVLVPVVFRLDPTG
jgi:protein TonB